MNAVQEKIKNIEYLIRGNETVIVNSGFEVTSLDHWTDAMSKVVSDNAQIVVGRSNGDLVRSKYLSFPKPLIIAMNHYVVPHRPKIDEECIVSRATILRRDNYVCYYCNGKGDTVDHITPKSKGGKFTWSNLITSCKPCNSDKADKLLSELGLEEPIIPAMNDENYRLSRVEKAVRNYIETAYMQTDDSKNLISV